MFSWLQTNFQKHYQILFAVLLVIIIFAFVFTIGDFAGIDSLNKERTANHRFYEFDLKTEEQKAAFFQDAALSAYIQFRGERLPSEQIQDYAFNRAAALHLANLHNIPGPNKSELTDFIKEMSLFQNPQGEFDPQIYTSALDGLKTSRNFSEGEISAVLEDDFRINKIQDALTNPGYVLPHEVLDDLKRAATTWSLAVAKFDFGTYNPDIDASDEKIETYFAANSQNYRTPDRRVISYVEYKALDLQKEVEADEEALKEYFELQRYKYEKVPETNGNAQLPSQIAEPTFEENKEKVALDYKLEKAKILAEDRATELVMAVVDAERNANNNLSVDSKSFAAILEEKGLSLKTTSPFGISETPIGLGWSRLVVSEAFKLVPGRFYSEPINSGDKTYVLFLKEEIEGSIPDLGSVKDKVLASYTAAEKARLRDEYGKQLKTELAAANANQDAFKSAAEAKNLNVETYADFKTNAPAEGLDASLLRSIDTLGQGDVSEMIPRGNEGIFIYITKKDVPDIQPEGDEYASRLDSLKQMYERVSVGQYMEVLTNKGLIEGQLIAPPAAAAN